MMKFTLEMPSVSKCAVTECAYNVEKRCHAKAITVGNGQSPGCDTAFLGVQSHSRDTKRIAGVGACKVSQCQYNSDFECAAKDIEVGFAQNKVNCLTYQSRA